MDIRRINSFFTRRGNRKYRQLRCRASTRWKRYVRRGTKGRVPGRRSIVRSVCTASVETTTRREHDVRRVDGGQGEGLRENNICTSKAPNRPSPWGIYLTT